MLANTNWTLLEFRAGVPDNVTHVDQDLCWYSSHHNFADFAHVWTGTRHYDLQIVEDAHGGSLQFILHTFEQGPLEENVCLERVDGSNAVGWVELFPVNP